jgi:hypothetical protein
MLCCVLYCKEIHSARYMQISKEREVYYQVTPMCRSTERHGRLMPSQPRKPMMLLGSLHWMLYFQSMRYEDLVDNKQQVAILEKVVSFLRFPLKFDRLECAFQIHRRYQENIVISGKSIRSGGSSVSQAYAALSKDTLCKIWNNVQDYSHHFGYRSYGNVSCSSSVEDASKRLRSSTGGNVEQPWKRLFGHDTSVGNQVHCVTN